AGVIGPGKPVGLAAAAAPVRDRAAPAARRGGPEDRGRVRGPRAPLEAVEQDEHRGPRGPVDPVHVDEVAVGQLDALPAERGRRTAAEEVRVDRLEVPTRQPEGRAVRGGRHPLRSRRLANQKAPQGASHSRPRSPQEPPDDPEKPTAPPPDPEAEAVSNRNGAPLAAVLPVPFKAVTRQ